MKLKQTITALLFTLVSSLGWSQQGPLPAVVVDPVSNASLDAEVSVNGTLYSRSFVDITAAVSGQLNWIVEPGTTAQAGDALATLDMLPLNLSLAEHKAQVKRARINASYQKNEWQRIRELHKTRAASQFQLDQIRSTYELAEADIEITELKLQQVEDRIERATVKAPFSGVVTERRVRAGTDVSRGDVLLKFLDTEQLEVRVFVPVKYLGLVRNGELLDISALGRQAQARISAVIPSADPRSQTVEVRAQVPAEMRGVWAAGQLVKIRVALDNEGQLLSVHRDALVLRKDATYVVKISADDTVLRVPVEVGKGNFDRVAVRGDLVAGDRVAVRGAERLQDGQKVKIQ